MKNKLFLFLLLSAIGLNAWKIQATNLETISVCFIENNVPNGYDVIFLHGDLASSIGPNSIVAGASDNAVYIGFNIADWIKDTQEEISCVNGGRLYFTDEGRYETYGSWHFDPIAGKYKIFTYYGNNIDTICIPHEDMEYYFANILNLWQNSGITERCIRNVYIHAMHFIDGLEFWTWRVRLYYAKPNCTDIDPLQ